MLEVSILIVTLKEAKKYLRVDHDDDDTIIRKFIGARPVVHPGVGVVADGVRLHHDPLDGDAGAQLGNVHQKATSRSVARM